MSKCLRRFYFRKHPEVKETRKAIGPEKFDAMYRKMYEFLANVHIGQYFVVSKICRNNPDNHDLVLMMCDIYHHMDFFVNMKYEQETDRVYMLPTFDGRTEGIYAPPDVYSKIIRNPKSWGVEPDDIL